MNSWSTGWFRRLCWLLVIILALLAATHLDTVFSVVSTAMTAVHTASSAWLTGAVVCAVGSMLAFAVLRRRTARAAGADLPLTAAISMTYAANAVQVISPGGSIVSTGYLVRRLRARNLGLGTVTWSLTVTQVLSGVSLAVLAVAGMVMTAGGSWTSFAPGAIGVLGLLVVVGWVVRYPAAADLVAVRTLALLNRMLRRPPQAGATTLRSVLADLRRVRPTARDWLAAFGAATLNWVLAFGCFFSCARALGVAADPLSVLVAFTVAMASTGISILPAGLGVVDGILLVGLTSVGAPTGAALGAVVLYRVVTLGGVLAGGLLATTAGRTRPASAPMDGGQLVPSH